MCLVPPSVSLLQIAALTRPMRTSATGLGTLLRTELHRAPAGMLPFIVRSADESIRVDLAQAAIAELNQRLVHPRDNETASIGRRGDLAKGIVAVVANTKPGNAQRLVAFVKRAADADMLIATYAQVSILVSNFDNVFAAGKLWSGPHLDRDVLAALCLEGLAPAAKPEHLRELHTKSPLAALLASAPGLVDPAETGGLHDCPAKLIHGRIDIVGIVIPWKINLKLLVDLGLRRVVGGAD